MGVTFVYTGEFNKEVNNIAKRSRRASSWMMIGGLLGTKEDIQKQLDSEGKKKQDYLNSLTEPKYQTYSEADRIQNRLNQTDEEWEIELQAMVDKEVPRKDNGYPETDPPGTWLPLEELKAWNVAQDNKEKQFRKRKNKKRADFFKNNVNVQQETMEDIYKQDNLLDAEQHEIDMNAPTDEFQEGWPAVTAKATAKARKKTEANEAYKAQLTAPVDAETRAELDANKAEAKKKGRAARDAIEDAKPQAIIDEAGFISKAEQATKLLSQENNPANYVEKYLRKKGVTDTEFADTDLLAFLRDKAAKNENVTRVDILEHMDASKPIQSEVVLTGDSKDASWVSELQDWQTMRGIPDDSIDIKIGDAEITVSQDEDGEYHATPTGQPGADNEIISQDGGVRSVSEVITQLQGHFRNAPQGDTMHSANTQRGLDPNTYEEYYITSDMVEDNGGFTHPVHHGNIENVVFHIRISVRTDDAGNKVLFIEELQSDLHQKARQKNNGYKDKSSDAYQAGLEPLAKVGRKLHREQQALIAKEQDKISKHYEETGTILNPPDAAGDYFFDKNEREIAERLERVEKYEKYISEKNPNFDLNSVQLHLYRDKDVLENLERNRSAFMSNIARGIVEKDNPELTKRIASKNAEIQKFKDEFNRAQPNAPLKNDKWIQAGLEKAIQIANGKGIGKVGWTTSQQQVNIWGMDAVKLYEETYDNKLPGVAKSLASQFNANTGKTKMTFTGEDGWSSNANINYIDISPELGKKVGKGINSYAKGGLVTNNQEERHRAHRDYLNSLTE
jgi:hypothetical protein